MFLPRRRITSLTLASLVVLTLWYLDILPGSSPRDADYNPPAQVKQKPPIEQLSPIASEDAPQHPVIEADRTEHSPLTATLSPLTDEPSTDIIFDHRPPPYKESKEDDSQTLAESGVSAHMITQEHSSSTIQPDKSTSTEVAKERFSGVAVEKEPSLRNASSTAIAPVPKIKTQSGQFIFGSRKFVEKHPVTKLRGFASGTPTQLPPLQRKGEPESPEARKKRLERLNAVKASFAHSWAGYKFNAWKKDEVKPVDGGSETSFGGWAATLVDTLDTLWIMGMKAEFQEAVEAVAEIDFTETEEETLNVFETTIRYLGGLIAAYDLSHGHEEYPILLEKAVELADFLYCAFDTPNRMPVTRWQWNVALDGEDQLASDSTLVAEIGSLTLEFTRLSQLTGDMKYYDAVTRIMEEFSKQQGATKIQGLWPIVMNARKISFEDTGFSLGGMADSLYEYLPKQYMLLGGQASMYEEMYKHAITASMNHIFFRPMLPDEAEVLIPGFARANEGGDIQTKPEAQHLGCYAGGMVGIAGKLFSHPEHLNMARKLVDGCIWAYEHMPTGIMPETFVMVPCVMNDECKWDESKWQQEVLKTKKYRSSSQLDELARFTTDEEKVAHLIEKHRLRPGFTDITDRRYILRPEAIESVFIHWRLTGDTDLPDKAWKMFMSIENATRTDIANSAIDDVTAEKPHKANRMESFWLAETLKYFYLMFSEVDVISLDEYVL